LKLKGRKKGAKKKRKLTIYSPPSSMGPIDILQPSAGGYVFTAPKSDGWVHEGESWNVSYNLFLFYLLF
jgi:hypothetical protein